MTSTEPTRWIVRNAVQTPQCGNGIWSRHRTRLGASLTLVKILRFRYGSGNYAIPAGGLIVTRGSEAFQCHSPATGRYPWPPLFERVRRDACDPS